MGRIIGSRGLAVTLACAWLLGCEEQCPKVSVCDLREHGCQRTTMKAVACLRGGSGDEDLPPVSVISEQDLIERVSSYDDEDPQARAEALARYALWNRGLALFQLGPAEYDVADVIADSAAETAAAYFPEDGDIVIIDRGEPLADEGAIEVFAHEIVHALQDRELDLTSYGQDATTSFDSDLAIEALIEGEAVHYQILAAVELAGRTPGELDWEGLYGDFRTDTLLDAEADEAPVALAGIRFPYAFGGAFVTQRWLARGRVGIDALFEDPPRTTSEVMFGSSAQLLEDARDALHDRAVPELPAAFVEQEATALGSWIARIYAARAGVAESLRLEPARELGADAFSVHYDEASDSVLAAWRARMLDGAQAASWPDPGDAALVVQLDDSRREATQLAAEGELPADAEQLAWRAPTEPEPDPGEAAAAASVEVALAGVARERFRACAVRRAPLWWRP